MLEKIYFNKPDHMDLNMYRCGMEDCAPGHSWGPALRDHYIIHYIRSGRGIVQINGATHSLSKGQGFLIPPNTIIYYQADNNDPWCYSWVGFHGLKAEHYLKQANLSEDSPVFNYSSDDSLEDCINQMIQTSKAFVNSSETKLLSLLYVFLSKLVESAGSTGFPLQAVNRKEQYIRKAIEYIAMNYSMRVNIKEIANYVGLDRSYLYLLFKENLNTSPQNFLINFRISKACELMQNKPLSIAEISCSVGYEDPLLFSKMFRRVMGKSPREFRKGEV